MSAVKKVFENTSIITVGRFFSKIIGFITTIMLARYLGVDLFGQYSIVLSFISIFLFLNDFGIAFYLVREISRNKDKTDYYMQNSVAIKFLLSVFAIIATSIFAFAFGYSNELVLLIFIYSFSILSGSISSLFSVVFQANLKMHFNILTEILQGVLFLIIVAYFSTTRGSLYELILLYAVSTFLIMAVGLYFAKKFATFWPLKFDFRLWKKLLSNSWPFALTTLFTAFYARIDVLVVSKLMNAQAVGLYSAAFRFTEALAFIPLALTISLYPLMSKYFKESKDSLKKTTRIAMKYLVTFFAPIVFGTVLLSKQMLRLVYGGEFLSPSSVSSMQVLMIAALFIFLNQLLVNLLNSINLEKSVLKIIFFGIIFNVALNLAFIPVWGITGAALATLIAEIIVFIVFYLVIKRDFYELPIVSISVKPLISAVLMSAFVMLFGSINIFLTVFLAAVLYFFIFFMIGGFSKEDFEILKKITAFSGR